MKTRTKMAALCAAALFVSFAWGCKNNTGGTPAPSNSETAQADTLSIDQVLENAASLVGQPLVFEGVCTHICSHGGQKIFLMGSDDSRMLRVEASKEVGSFPKETVNSIVTVWGTVVEDRIDEAYLSQWEEQLKAAEKSTGDHQQGDCTVEQQARGESATATAQARIADYREKIARRKAEQGKDYLSFYHAEASEYRIQ